MHGNYNKRMRVYLLKTSLFRVKQNLHVFSTSLKVYRLIPLTVCTFILHGIIELFQWAVGLQIFMRQAEVAAYCA